VRHRLRESDPDAGAYAILYAVLVVVLLGMGAVVIDFAQVRQDRRLDRSATDAASLGGVAFLDSTVQGGAQPHDACLRAWGYLSARLGVAVPAGACSNFNRFVVGNSPYESPANHCAATPVVEIDDERTIGNRTFRVAWPIPSTGGTGFLNPDIAPGQVTQPQNTAASPAPTNTDGYSNGCDKLGVAIFENQPFGLATAFGATGTTTQVHSVALIVPGAGGPDDAAALNVLNVNQCPTIRTTGTGNILVGPTLNNDGSIAGPGIIAVESTGTKPNGTRGCSSSNDKTIDAGTSGTSICALANTSPTCVAPYGKILAHALDIDPANGHGYSGNVFPTPMPEGLVHGYVPITHRYGCATLSNCLAPTPNYIARLVAAYGGSGNPGSTVYDGSQAPYTTPAGSFTAPAELCPGGKISGLHIIPSGYNYAGCDLKIGSTGVVIVQGGTLVVNGDIEIDGGGCFVMNSAASTCPTAPAPGSAGAEITTPVAPTSDAVIFVRGTGCPNPACINVAGSIVWPQTFVYMGGTSPFVYSGTTFSLWTAPGAGLRTPPVTGRTTLEQACYDSAQGKVVGKCLDSRFARLNFWTEHTSSSLNHTFTGQANLSIVGIFFAPNDLFNLSGGQNLSAVAAQFWADRIDISGSGTLPLSPYLAFSQGSNLPDLVLIR
jgi:hypothetical protein